MSHEHLTSSLGEKSAAMVFWQHYIYAPQYNFRHILLKISTDPCLNVTAVQQKL